MEQLRPVELTLIDELFGMSSGYVLDFTNATFADFFRLEVGINIYDPVYATNGGSKGKHLRSFLTIGQPRAIGRALAALWEYREAGRLARAEAETVINARGRLSAIVERLGGGALLNYDPPTETTKASSAPSAPATNETKLRELEGRFLELHQMGDEPQARGRHFETLLTELFNAWRMDARVGFTLVGEQIDGSFQLLGAPYLLEAKWQSARVNADTLRAFQGKVEERPEWTRGLFVSFSGFTDVGLQAFTARKIILADGMDIYDALRRRLSIPDIIAAKIRHASEYREPFRRVRDLIPL